MLTAIKNKVTKYIGRIHSDERGLEAIQVVIILAIAAVACITIKMKWEGQIREFFNSNVDTATQFAP